MLTFLGEFLVTLTIAIAVLFLLLAVLGVLLVSWDQKRIAALPKECKQALENAKRASRACREMCEAASVTQSLSNASIDNPSAKLIDENGPGEEELMQKTKAHTLEALERCLALSIEGIKLTTNARYVLLRGLYRAAKAACEGCKPTAGLEVCPACELLGKIKLET